MRAEIETESGVRSRPNSRLGMPSPRIGPPSATGDNHDEQSEWARQEQQAGYNSNNRGETDPLSHR